MLIIPQEMNITTLSVNTNHHHDLSDDTTTEIYIGNKFVASNEIYIMLADLFNYCKQLNMSNFHAIKLNMILNSTLLIRYCAIDVSDITCA